MDGRWHRCTFFRNNSHFFTWKTMQKLQFHKKLHASFVSMILRIFFSSFAHICLAYRHGNPLPPSLLYVIYDAGTLKTVLWTRLNLPPLSLETFQSTNKIKFWNYFFNFFRFLCSDAVDLPSWEIFTIRPKNKSYPESHFGIRKPSMPSKLQVIV